MRRALVVALLAACQPPAPEALPKNPSPVEPTPAVTPSPATRAPELCGIPFVLRCPTGNEACHMFVRIHRLTGAVEALSGSYFHGPTPILVDDQRVYWPGRAREKSDLSAVQLAWRGSAVRYLEQDDRNLVVVDEQGVYLLPKNGLAREEIFASNEVWSADAGEDFVAWTSDSPGGGAGAVMIRDSTGGETTLGGTPSPYGARVAGDDLFWFDFGDTGPANPRGMIHRLNMEASLPVTLADKQYVPRDLAVLDNVVYWVTDEAEGRVVRRVPVEGGEVEKLGVSHELEGQRGNGDHIVAHGDHVYWNAAHSVVRVHKAGGGRPEIVVTVAIPGDIANFAIDDEHVYVAAQMYRTRKAGEGW